MLPFAKRHCTPSKLFETIFVGFSTVTPPSASISERKPAKSTTATWFTRTVVSSRTVAIASAGPPSV